MRLRKTSLAILLAILATLASVPSVHSTSLTASQTSQDLLEAERIVGVAFNATLDAERTGADISNILITLNPATSLLAQAEEAARTGNANATDLAARAVYLCYQVNTAALDAQIATLDKAQNTRWITLILTVIVEAAFIVILIQLWRQLKKNYIRTIADAKPEVNE